MMSCSNPTTALLQGFAPSRVSNERLSVALKPYFTLPSIVSWNGRSICDLTTELCNSNIMKTQIWFAKAKLCQNGRDEISLGPEILWQNSTFNARVRWFSVFFYHDHESFLLEYSHGHTLAFIVAFANIIPFIFIRLFPSYCVYTLLFVVFACLEYLTCGRLASRSNLCMRIGANQIVPQHSPMRPEAIFSCFLICCCD